MKKIVALVLVLMLTVGLTACSEEEKGTEQTVTEQKNTEQNAGEEKDAEQKKPEKSQVPSKSDLLKKDQEEVEETKKEPETSKESETPAPQEPTRFLKVLRGTNFLEEWVSETGTCRVTWETMALGAEDAAAYPELDATLKTRNMACQASANRMLQELLPNAVDQDLYGNSRFYVQRADTRILSFLDDVYLYDGGDAVTYLPEGVNLDPKTGAYLLLEEVLTETDSLPAVLEQKLHETYPQEVFEDFRAYLEESEDTSDYVWTLGYEGITFYFSPSILAAEEEGVLSATLQFTEYPELFRKEYVADPELEYAIALAPYIELGYGEQRTIAVEPMPDEFDYYDVLMMSRDGTNYMDQDNFAYQFCSYLVRTIKDGENRYFLYVESLSENDYNILSIYDLNGTGVDLVNQMFGTGFSGEWHEDEGEYGTYYQDVLQDLSGIRLETRLEVLGTNAGIKSYTVDQESGDLIPVEEYYEFVYPMELYTKVKLECFMLPMYSWDELPEGTKVTLLRTDGAYWVEVLLEDKRECQIEVDMTDWPKTVNKLPEEECFEGILYAG